MATQTARVKMVSDITEPPIATINPASGELSVVFEPLTDREIAIKLQRADAAFERFSRITFGERSELLLAVARILEEESATFARLITTEMGKLLRTSQEEVEKCAWTCRYYAEHAKTFLADEAVRTSATRSYIRYEPMGPILGVITWNFPFWQVFRFAAPALMAGNVCLIKHAPNVPQCSLAIEEVFRRAGADDGIVQSLLLRYDQLDQFVNDDRVAAVTVTGSVETGRRLASAAGDKVKKVVLELGGNDAFIVMPSANLEAAVAAGVEARITAAGQSCTAAKRFIIADVIADKFEQLFVEQMRGLKIGDPFKPDSEIGPVATERLLARLERQVRQSVAAGCTLLAGGKRLNRPGNYFSPTVLSNIVRNSPAYTEELYGPVAALFRINNIDEAIELANDSPMALGASVWSNDPFEQQRFIENIKAGVVFVNKRVRSDPRLPFGGMKQSGFGRELGVEGIRQFTSSKSVWIQNQGASESIIDPRTAHRTRR